MRFASRSRVATRSRRGGRGGRVATAILLGAAMVPLLAAGAGAGDNGVFGVSPHPTRLAGQVRRAILVPIDGSADVQDAVRVWNSTSKPVTLRVYAAEAGIQSRDVIAIGDARPGPGSPASRVRVAQATLRLAPKRDAIVSVTVPASTFTTADQLAAVVVEQEPEGHSAGIDLVQRVAVLIRPSTTAVAVSDPPSDRRSLPYAAGAVLVLVLAIGAYAMRRRHARPRSPVPAPVRREEVPEPVATVEPEIEITVAAPEMAEQVPALEALAGVGALSAAAARPGRAPRKRSPRPPSKLNYIPIER